MLYLVNILTSKYIPFRQTSVSWRLTFAVDEVAFQVSLLATWKELRVVRRSGRERSRNAPSAGDTETFIHTSY